jgi:Transposase DDE domain group 1
VANDPLLTGILKVAKLPPQCTFWRFLASLHLGVAGQLLEVQRRMRERVWEAGNVRLSSITLDTDTTVHTVYGKQMGARKSYNPKNKGKKSFQPILTFVAETREYLWGELRNGDRPDGKQIARHLEAQPVSKLRAFWHRSWCAVARTGMSTCECPGAHFWGDVMCLAFQMRSSRKRTAHHMHTI